MNIKTIKKLYWIVQCIGWAILIPAIIYRLDDHWIPAIIFISSGVFYFVAARHVKNKELEKLR
jgi:hypothetical protein